MEGRRKSMPVLNHKPTRPLFLGLDSSTQSLSAVVVDFNSRKVVYEASLSFDKTASGYGTQNGVLRNPDPLVVHSPPLMWLETLDALFRQMTADGVPLGEVLAVAGSGQQHGSVYLNDSSEKALAALDPKKDLRTNLAAVFSRSTSPIWMDSSTAGECDEIRQVLGGIEKTAKATGSDAFERFTGPQIRKFHKTDDAAYRQTRHICLVSSFMASVLSGRIAPIDHGDGSGMNLMDIASREWHKKALDATAPGLLEKLPPLAPSWEVIGTISPYFVQKYGINPTTLSVAWSGDNPCSLVGLGLIEEGMAAISLGTSDTFFGCMKKCRTDQNGEGHVFVTPTGDYMSLICFKNGSLARERVRDQYGLDWKGFNAAMAGAPPGNRGSLMLPWFEAEIVPRVNRPGVRRLDLDESDAGANCRAVVEAQMLSMRLHSAWMKVKPKSIYATGGGSVNPAILQVMADVMNCPVLRIEVAKSAALGAALRAAHAHFAHSGSAQTWKEIAATFTSPLPNSRILPDPATVPVYDALLVRYAAFEKKAVGQPDPA
ncbi:MAG: carbohydrate kinase [Verrucomicrobia bacterium]|nr:carbohydrate kinase [Verrucomicrobiota bacterium]